MLGVLERTRQIFRIAGKANERSLERSKKVDEQISAKVIDLIAGVLNAKDVEIIERRASASIVGPGPLLICRRPHRAPP